MYFYHYRGYWNLYSWFSHFAWSHVLSIFIFIQVKNLLAVDPEAAVPLRRMMIRKIPRCAKSMIVDVYPFLFYIVGIVVDKTY